MLHSLKPDHHFFKKDFVPKKAIDKLLIDNSDGFFDHLPPGKYKKRIGVVFKEPEENRLKRQMSVYQKRLESNQKKLKNLKVDSDSEVDEEDEEDSKSDGVIDSSSQIFT